MATGVAEPKASPKAKPIDANTLAWWAEEAHGKEKKALFLVVNDDGVAELLEAVPPGKQALLEVTPHMTRPALVKPGKVSIFSRGGSEINLTQMFPEADALFWSVSSIEKFLFPYYYAQRLYDDSQINELKTKFRNDKKLIAALHQAPSRTTLVSTTLFCSQPETVDEPEWISIMDYLALK